MELREVMTRWPVTVTPETSVMEARRLLGRHGCRHLPVVRGDAVVGMVSDRDLLLRDRQLAEALGQLRSDLVSGRYRHVGDVMSAPPLTVTADTTVAAAAALLRRRGVSALPVVEDGHLVGIATSSDLLSVLADVAPAPPRGGAATAGVDPPDDTLADIGLPEDLVRVPLGPGDARPGRSVPRPTALVVDPDPAVCTRLWAELTDDGYEVTTCPGPTTATLCPARDGAGGKRCTRLPADVAFIAVDQASARTRLLEAYADWAPGTHLRITDTLTASAEPSEPPRP